MFHILPATEEHGGRGRSAEAPVGWMGRCEIRRRTDWRAGARTCATAPVDEAALYHYAAPAGCADGERQVAVVAVKEAVALVEATNLGEHCARDEPSGPWPKYADVSSEEPLSTTHSSKGRVVWRRLSKQARVRPIWLWTTSTTLIGILDEAEAVTREPSRQEAVGLSAFSPKRREQTASLQMVQ